MLKIGVFVDCAALCRGCSRQFNSNKVDFDALFKQLTSVGTIGQSPLAFVTHLSDGDRERQNQFNGWLVHHGYEVRVKTSKKYKEGDDYRHVTWNVGMTLAIVDSMSNWDIAVIASGDGCLIDLAKYLVRKKKSVYTAGFKCSTSMELIKFSKKFIELDESVVYKKNRTKASVQ